MMLEWFWAGRRAVVAGAACWVLAGCAGAPPPAATATPAQTGCAKIAPLLTPLIEEGWVASASVALVERDQAELCSFGSARPGVPATADTLYEIGSLTKLFTGVLLAQMVGASEVTLEQPVGSLISSRVAEGARPVTLLDLATHRSGLPRLPSNLTPRDADNPYADYGAAQLFDFVARSQPAPTSEPSYSNLGAALLGLALAQRAGKQYGALLAERVLQPLRMTNTYLDVPQAQQDRRAQGHDADAEPRPAWDLDAFAPAGGLRSSARDMARFLSAVTQPSGPLGAAFRLAEQPHARTRGDNQLGLFIHQRADGSLWHNGQTGGFASYLAVDPSRGAGVCLLLSTTFARSDELGDRLLQVVRGERAAPLALPVTGPEPSSQALQAYVGEYWLSDDFSIRIFSRAGRLHARATGQEAFRLWPSGPDHFHLRSIDARLEFERASQSVVALYLVQGGARQRGARR